MNNIEIKCNKRPWDFSIDFVIMERNAKSSTIAFAEPIIMKWQEYDPVQVEPTFTLDITKSQQLMDELWQCGLRPSEGTGSAGSLKATEKHLEDMRKIAFKQLDMDKS